MTHNMEDVVVSETQVGLGLFSAKDFSACDLIGYVTGEIVEDDEYSSNYCIDLSNGTGLEPEAPFRFLNHRCDPNCQLYLVDETCPTTGADIIRVIVESVRDIIAGEELTIDYGWPADHAIECLCGSSKCRGWIVSNDELPLLQSRKTAV